MASLSAEISRKLALREASIEADEVEYFTAPTNKAISWAYFQAAVITSAKH